MPILNDMGCHMKTTLDVSDVLFAEAKRVAHRDGTTLRALVERGLTLALNEKKHKSKPFTLRDGSVRGSGVTAEFLSRGGWSNLREIANER